VKEEGKLEWVLQGLKKLGGERKKSLSGFLEA
jgi:hypothetical protein